MALSPRAFVTLTEVKTQLGISDSSEDSKLEFLITAATDLVEKYCGRSFNETTHTEELYDGEDSNTLFLKNYPVSDEVADAPVILVDDEAVDVEDVNYQKGILELASIVNAGLSNIKATYKGGYATDDIPFDLKQAIILIVARARNAAKNSGVVSESVGDYSVAYQSAAAAMTKDVKEILVNYKRF